MKLLALETSCDETAAAVLSFSDRADGVSYAILGEMLHSQAPQHARYSGVYPTLAKREHQKTLPSLVADLLHDLGLLRESADARIIPEVASVCDRDPILLEGITALFSRKRAFGLDAIAVTRGPGLSPALWVGVNFARAVSLLWDTPLIPVNHLEGHIAAALIDPRARRIIAPPYPLIALLVSGGHTQLVLSERVGEYRILGKTLDDAAGEAFDKVARLLGLPYPGGPEISALASSARERNLSSPVSFPRPMSRDQSLNFSYSGLKTAVRTFLEKHPRLSDDDRAAVAMEFEDSVVDTLREKTARAIAQYRPGSVVLSGGVSANARLREQMTALLDSHPSVSLYMPSPALATDNAVMIALAAFIHRDTAADAASLDADPNLSFPDAAL